MMKIKVLGFLIITVLLSSCGSDIETTVTVEYFRTSITKRPNANQRLGQITASNIDLLSFSIINQTYDNALSIDQNTGEIFVNDSARFNINDVNKIEAEIEVISGKSVELTTATVVMNLPESTIEYFKEIALGFENGNSSEIVRKWKSTMKVYLAGTPSPSHISKVQQSIDDINNLATDGFSARIVQSQSQSNCFMYFGTVSDYEDLFPGTVVGSNFALFNVWWSNDVIREARIFIDIERTTSTQQQSLILEEITQVLGLGKDSPRFPSSIFYETSTNGGFATVYTEMDQELVRLLYHPDMTIGLDEFRTDAALRNILKSEW